MSLEATLVMLDNSASSINGDYEPTRWESQVMCAELLIQSKLQSNQQSSVGVGLMGGSQVQILCTLTADETKASSYLFGLKSSGELHFANAIQIGALSLKHRSNDTQKPRMICFVGSTIREDIETLKILAKKLKKNAVAVDIVCFGDVSEEQINKVQTFVSTIQNEDNSHCLIVEPGTIMSDKLIESPIVGGGVQQGAGDMGGMEEEDPELAAAIRASLEEAQQGAPQPVAVPVIPAPQPSGQSQPEANYHEPTEEELQQLAIQMSLQDLNQKQEQEKPKVQQADSKKEQAKQGEDKEKKE